MRLTVNLADDTYAVAKSLAQEEETTVSDAVNKLLRRALEPMSARKSRKKWNDGLPVSPGRRMFTCADVDRVEAENE